jgi:hypothetical protein
MAFRRIEEVVEPEPVGPPPFKAIDVHQHRTESTSPKVGGVIHEAIEDSASDFKRVRLLYQKYHYFGKNPNKFDPIRFTDPMGCKSATRR